MEVVIHGVRGSIPNPEAGQLYYGGNTSCVEFLAEDGTLLFFDAGTGIREAGKRLRRFGECHIFISHGHLDHFLGFWMFAPLHLKDWTIHLYLPKWLKNLPEEFYNTGLFPVHFKNVNSNLMIHLVEEDVPLTIKDLTITPFATNHPGGNYGYKVLEHGKTFVYTGDHEITDDDEARKKAQSFIQDAEIAVVDGMYNRENYQKGFGHSAWEDWFDIAKVSNVHTLLFSHHDPDISDKDLDMSVNLLNDTRDNDKAFNAFFAQEGMCFSTNKHQEFYQHSSDWLFQFIENLARYSEESVILDLILEKAREITSADAGTIFLRKGDDLVFSYTHNDTLFKPHTAYKHAYANFKVPITKESISGYVAMTGELLNIDNVYDIDPSAPYSYNSSFDEKSGYRCRSMLTIPFLGYHRKVIGVMQLINATNKRTGDLQSFNRDMIYNARLLAHEVSSVLMRSELEKHTINALLRAANIHDPTETGAHAERVGAIAAEIYQRYAEKIYTPVNVIRFERNRIRLAAMLHDIGKVGISDTILKKPDRLTDAEYEIMQNHTVLSESLLDTEASTISKLAHDIALHHHQRWDGKGYPVLDGKCLEGNEIPLPARITAVADVYDALVSPRCYKEPWPPEEAMMLIQSESGKHFDPEVVTCMVEIGPLIESIYKRYPDNH